MPGAVAAASIWFARAPPLWQHRALFWYTCPDAMTDTNALPLEPKPEILPGGTPGRELKRLLLSTRPQFLTASALPVVVGSAWAFGFGAGFSVLLFALALAGTLLVHAGCNVLNDVSDEWNGSDRANEERIYPFTGGSRFIQNGVLGTEAMTRWGVTLLAAGAAAGVVLLTLRGPGIIAFGLAGVALGIAYSLPPASLVSRGLGEAVIAITFGWLPVAGAAWLQGAALDAAVTVLSVPVGLWVASILLLNEVPDAPADERVGKRTLVVRFGLDGTALIYLALHLLPIAAIGWLVAAQALHVAVLLWALPGMALAWRVAAAVRRYSTDRRDEYTAAIRTNLALQGLGSVWLAVFAAIG